MVPSLFRVVRSVQSAVPPPLVCRFRLLFRVGVSPVARRDRSDAQNCRCAAPSGVACARVPVSASRVVALVPVTRPSRPKTVCACRARSASRGRATHTVPPPRVQVPPAPLRWSRLRACARPVRHCSSCTRRSSPGAARAVSSRRTASAFPQHRGVDLRFHQPPHPRAPTQCHRWRSLRSRLLRHQLLAPPALPPPPLPRRRCRCPHLSPPAVRRVRSVLRRSRCAVLRLSHLTPHCCHARALLRCALRRRSLRSHRHRASGGPGWMCSVSVWEQPRWHYLSTKLM